MKKNIYMFLPGLLSPMFPERNRVDSLSKLLSRAACCYHEHLTLEKAIKTFFTGLDHRAIPAGALTALRYNLILPADQGHWCRADPVTTIVDHRTAMISGYRDLEYTAAEQSNLIDSLNILMQEEGITLAALSTHEWVCSLPYHQDVAMNDLLEIMYRPLNTLLPSGPDQGYWHRLLTEIQMALMSSPVNQTRLQQNIPPLSSLWFWGLGQLPQQVKTTFTQVYTNDSVIHGLALCAQVPIFELPLAFEKQMTVLEEGNTLIADLQFYVLQKHQQWADWHHLLSYYEQHWFTPLLLALEMNAIDTVTIGCGDGREFIIKKRHLRYFWRKIKSLSLWNEYVK